jgi:hypothetical protein
MLSDILDGRTHFEVCAGLDRSCVYGRLYGGGQVPEAELKQQHNNARTVELVGVVLGDGGQMTQVERVRDGCRCRCSEWIAASS